MIIDKIKKKQNIRLFIMDVDGTLTDGKIYMSDKGELFKAFSIKDGHGIKNLLPAANIIPVVITGRESRFVEIRCKELGIKHIIQGCQNKIEAINKLVADANLSWENVAYIGDDEIDLECMRHACLAGCPANAIDSIIGVSDFVSKRDGGDGAVRDFIEWIVSTK